MEGNNRRHFSPEQKDQVIAEIMEKMVRTKKELGEI